VDRTGISRNRAALRRILRRASRHQDAEHRASGDASTGSSIPPGGARWALLERRCAAGDE
jgi:hypothetical protein